ncbi:hypothetical protein LC608_31725 [Nostoc sp. XA010]|uniref:Uncharacterized protein n=1 Tax=Nostoc cf. commune SO-36 TaxID=449208 RepID=A0ABM7ZCH5_NOSCO|nr:hypothetical protein [Nostoc sp. XA010]MCC5661443.1 hypothetical protein [Nostoc sp. XA010]BDI21027.1 hypothetical protein ANSO36C_68290 [Nostoc cf. commune SO-36]
MNSVKVFENMKFRVRNLVALFVIVFTLFFVIPTNYNSLNSVAHAATIEEKLSIIDQATYSSYHSSSLYEKPLNILSPRCGETKEKIGDWAFIGTKILNEHGGNVDNYRMLNSIVIQTEGRSNLSCKDEFQTLTTLLLVGLM